MSLTHLSGLLGRLDTLLTLKTHLDNPPVYSEGVRYQLVVEEHAVHHGVHLHVADAPAEEGDGVPPNLDGLEREGGEGSEDVEDGVLRRESIQTTEQDGYKEV